MSSNNPDYVDDELQSDEEYSEDEKDDNYLVNLLGNTGITLKCIPKNQKPKTENLNLEQVSITPTKKASIDLNFLPEGITLVPKSQTSVLSNLPESISVIKKVTTPKKEDFNESSSLSIIKRKYSDDSEKDFIGNSSISIIKRKKSKDESLNESSEDVLQKLKDTETTFCQSSVSITKKKPVGRLNSPIKKVENKFNEIKKEQNSPEKRLTGIKILKQEILSPKKSEPESKSIDEKYDQDSGENNIIENKEISITRRKISRNSSYSELESVNSKSKDSNNLIENFGVLRRSARKKLINESSIVPINNTKPNVTKRNVKKNNNIKPNEDNQNINDKRERDINLLKSLGVSFLDKEQTENFDDKLDKKQDLVKKETKNNIKKEIPIIEHNKQDSVKDEKKVSVKNEKKVSVKDEIKVPEKDDIKIPVKDEKKFPLKDEKKVSVKNEKKVSVKDEKKVIEPEKVTIKNTKKISDTCSKESETDEEFHGFDDVNKGNGNSKSNLPDTSIKNIGKRKRGRPLNSERGQSRRSKYEWDQEFNANVKVTGTKRLTRGKRINVFNKELSDEEEFVEKIVEPEENQNRRVTRGKKTNYNESDYDQIAKDYDIFDDNSKTNEECLPSVAEKLQSVNENVPELENSLKTILDDQKLLTKKKKKLYFCKKCNINLKKKERYFQHLNNHIVDVKISHSSEDEIYRLCGYRSYEVFQNHKVTLKIKTNVNNQFEIIKSPSNSPKMSEQEDITKQIKNEEEDKKPEVKHMKFEDKDDKNNLDVKEAKVKIAKTEDSIKTDEILFDEKNEPSDNESPACDKFDESQNEDSNCDGIEQAKSSEENMEEEYGDKNLEEGEKGDTNSSDSGMANSSGYKDKNNEQTYIPGVRIRSLESVQSRESSTPDDSGRASASSQSAYTSPTLRVRTNLISPTIQHQQQPPTPNQFTMDPNKPNFNYPPNAPQYPPPPIGMNQPPGGFPSQPMYGPGMYGTNNYSYQSNFNQSVPNQNYPNAQGPPPLTQYGPPQPNGNTFWLNSTANNMPPPMNGNAEEDPLKINNGGGFEEDPLQVNAETKDSSVNFDSSENPEFVSIDNLLTCSVCQERFTEVSLLDEHKRKLNHFPPSVNNQNNVPSTALSIPQPNQLIPISQVQGGPPNIQRTANFQYSVQHNVIVNNVIQQPMGNGPGAGQFPPQDNSMHHLTQQVNRMQPANQPYPFPPNQQQPPPYGQYRMPGPMGQQPPPHQQPAPHQQPPPHQQPFPGQQQFPQPPQNFGNFQNQQQNQDQNSVNQNVPQNQQVRPVGGIIPASSLINQQRPLVGPPSATNFNRVSNMPPNQGQNIRGGMVSTRGGPSSVRGNMTRGRGGVMIGSKSTIQARGGLTQLANRGGRRQTISSTMQTTPEKRKKLDVLSSGDDDCQMISVQERSDGLPEIQNVQGAEENIHESLNKAGVHLSDSITLTSVKNNNQNSVTVKPIKGSNSDVANILATRGITVTSTQKSKPTNLNSANSATINLNSSVSIIPAKSKSVTVDLTDDDESKTDKPYKCCICPRQYNSQQMYLQHVATHSLPFKCDNCLAGFSKQIELINHNKICKSSAQQSAQNGTNRFHTSVEDFGLPVVDLRKTAVTQRLKLMGIQNYLPIGQGADNGVYGIPLITVDSKNISLLNQFGTNNVLNLGPIKSLR